jgi:Zn finger protein HypA/HybF involved in hydrogenase expression
MSDDFKIECPKCGQPIDCPAELFDNLVTCPSCQEQILARPIRVGASKSAETDSCIVKAAPSEFSPVFKIIGFLISGIGYLSAMTFGAGAFFGLVLAPTVPVHETVLGIGLFAVFFAVSVLVIIVGDAFLKYGRKARYVCGTCGNSIENEGVKMCPVCRVKFAHLRLPK